MKSAGGHIRYLVYMDMDAAAGFVILYLLCFVAWSLIKYWKNVNFDFAINLNFAFTFFNFYFIRNKINAILLHTCRLYLLKI